MGRLALLYCVIFGERIMGGNAKLEFIIQPSGNKNMIIVLIT